jgi:hypothetical protein
MARSLIVEFCGNLKIKIMVKNFFKNTTMVLWFLEEVANMGGMKSRLILMNSTSIAMCPHHHV